jgi:6,7-dimethyl-8-ribityllumazine synthase
MSQRSRVLILQARFYEDIAADLGRGARAALDAAHKDHETIDVPGSFELPAALRFALDADALEAERRQYLGYVVLGCVIRGETDHYDHVCRETSRAVMELAVGERIALGFGLLTCETYAQARVRAAPDGKDRGGDAARACLRMMTLKQSFGR